MLAVTALLLAGAFYLTYRKREVECESEACQTRGASRASKIMLWLATVAVIAFAAFPYYSGRIFRVDARSGAESNSPVAANSDSNSKEAMAVIRVEGMTCDACATAVQLSLNELKGVRSAEVSYEKKEAKVAYDPALVGPEQMKAAIEGAGFKATQTGLLTKQ